MTEREVLEHLCQHLAKQGKPFEELPKFRQYIEIRQQFIGNEQQQRLRALRFNYWLNGYALNDAGQVIGLSLKAALQNTFHIEEMLLQYAFYIRELNHLYWLDLSNNYLKDVTPLTSFTQLTSLDVSNNDIADVTPLASLMRLTHLNLQNNHLTDVSPLVKLTQLINLDISHNQLIDVTSLAGFTQLTFINLQGNPLQNPPVEIVSQDFNAVIAYLRQIREDGLDALYEGKLLILGEPGAGKTTFAQKILNDAYQLQLDEISTKGIDVLQWEFPIETRRKDGCPKNFRVNIWDFAGQEIYNATHQFFLTKRSLYVLVADSRKEDTDFYYWLNIVSLLSDNSPIIILKNEKQDRLRELPERQLRAEFTNLKEILPANLATNRGLEIVIDTVRHYLKHLPHVGSVLPKTWVNVRQVLEQDKRNYIPVEEYYHVCERYDFKRRDDQLQLSGYLHDLGVCLHFQDDDLLKKTVILKPEWGTAAVYKVLDNPIVLRNLGCFTKEDLKTIWHEDEYADMRGELLQLMMKFQLCYEIPGCPGRYIAPQLLSENLPDYPWNDTDNLRVRYAYEFMPKGMLTRFIVATHPSIEAQRLVWKSGVVLQKEGARAEIIEYYGKHEIHIRISGKNKKELLTVVMYEFDKIHGAYSRLKYDTLIPCNCIACKGSIEPHFYKYDTLKDFLANRQYDIQCQKKPYQMVDVTSLLDDILNRWQYDKDSELMENIIQELSAFLTPLPCFANEPSRRAVLINAGLSDLLPFVNLSGSAYECIASFLNDFELYGRTDALMQLLLEIRKVIGGEKQQEIGRLMAMVKDPRQPPRKYDDVPLLPKQMQNTIYAQNVNIQQGDKPMATNTQINNQIQNLQGDLIQNSQNFTAGAKTYNLQTPQDLSAFLAELQKKIAQSPLPDDVKEEMAHEVKTAEIQAKKEKPDKKKAADALDNANTILTKIIATVPQAVTLGQMLGKAIEYVGQWL